MLKDTVKLVWWIIRRPVVRELILDYARKKIFDEEKVKNEPKVKEKEKDQPVTLTNLATSDGNFGPLCFWHDQYPDSVHWRFAPGYGIEVKELIDKDRIQEKQPLRTKGEPITMRRIWSKYRTEIELWSTRYRVPMELIMATIATESGGNAQARREEPGYTSDEKTPHRVSVGLMQTLISTARSATFESSIDAKWLTIPANSIQAGTAYIRQQLDKTGFDPPLVAAAYNAGDVYWNDGEENKFKLKCYPIGTDHHVDRFCRFFGDACHVLQEEKS